MKDRIPKEGDFSVTLPATAWGHILAALQRKRHQQARKIDPDFVPAPGHIDVNRRAIAIIDAALAAIKEQIDAAGD